MSDTAIIVLLWLLLAFITGWLLDAVSQHIDRRNARRKRQAYRDRYL